MTQKNHNTLIVLFKSDGTTKICHVWTKTLINRPEKMVTIDEELKKIEASYQFITNYS